VVKTVLVVAELVEEILTVNLLVQKVVAEEQEYMDKVVVDHMVVQVV
jgi:hypothetical protein